MTHTLAWIMLTVYLAVTMTALGAYLLENPPL